MPTYGKQFSNIYDQVGADCGDEDSSFDASIKRVINDVGRSIFNRMSYSWKQREADLTPVASQQYLNMADVAAAWDDDTPVTIFYRNSANQRTVLDPLDDSEWDKQEDLDEGDIEAFHITKKSGAWRILFTFVPDSNFISSYAPLKMEYDTKWVELSADADIPGIPTSHHQLLVYRSNEIVCGIMGDTDLAAYWKSKADKEQGLLNKKQVQRLGRPKRVRPRSALTATGRPRERMDYNK